MIYNRIPIALGGLTKVKGPAINYQYDQKQILILTGLELPDYYTVDFCNDGDQQTKPMVGTADGVEIPDEFLLTGRPVKAYLIVTGEDDGAVETRYEITLPVNQRPARTDITPTPAEQSTIDGLIEAMNQAVTDTEEAAEQAGQAVLHYPKVVNEYWYVWDVTAEDYVNTGYKATGSGTGISDAYLNADYTLTIEFTDGTSYTTPSIRGEPGPVGATPDFDIGTVTTGQPGTPASATITGTAAKPLLNLTIPKGDPGEVTQSEFDTAIGTINSALTSLSSVTEIIDTASGAIASFPDGAGLPMRSLVAQINPVQDLHGYANPWPAGGGVNKLDPSLVSVYGGTAVGFTWTWDSNTGACTISGTFSGSNAGASFRLLATPSSIRSLKVRGFSSSSNYDGLRWQDGADQIVVDLKNLVYGTSYNIVIYPLVYEGSTAPTAWTPYANICPISGWTGLQGKRIGKNLVDISEFAKQYPVYCSFSDGILSVTTNNILYNVGINVSIPTGAIINYTVTLGTATNFRLRTVFADGTYEDHTSPIPWAATKDIVALRFNWSSAGTFTLNNFQVELGSTASTYEEYTGEAISVSWQDEAGTVYGGTATYNGDGTWTLVVDHAIVDLGTLTWNAVATSTAGKYRQYSTNLVGYVKAVARNNELASITCETYPAKTADQTYGRTFGISINTSANVLVYDEMYSGENDSAAFTASVSGVKLAYPVVNPQTYTITTGELISTLVGQNNIWVDTGDVTVTYQASIKGYIDKVLGQ